MDATSAKERMTHSANLVIVECKVLQQDCTTGVDLRVDRDLPIIDHFSYIESYLTKDGTLVAEASTRISKARPA